MMVGGDDVCPIAPLAPLMQDGWTALMYAADRGDMEVFEALLQRGADIHTKDSVRPLQGHASGPSLLSPLTHRQTNKPPYIPAL